MKPKRERKKKDNKTACSPCDPSLWPLVALSRVITKVSLLESLAFKPLILPRRCISHIHTCNACFFHVFSRKESSLAKRKKKRKKKIEKREKRNHVETFRSILVHSISRSFVSKRSTCTLLSSSRLCTSISRRQGTYFLSIVERDSRLPLKSITNKTNLMTISRTKYGKERKKKETRESEL